MLQFPEAKAKPSAAPIAWNEVEWSGGRDANEKNEAKGIQDGS
jgi:hypothetical protein